MVLAQNARMFSTYSYNISSQNGLLVVAFQSNVNCLSGSNVCRSLWAKKFGPVIDVLGGESVARSSMTIWRD